MRAACTRTIDGREITIRELTVAEIDGALPGAADKLTTLDLLLDELYDLSGSLLAASTGLPVTELSALTPSALRPLAEGFREVNPDFLALIGGLSARAARRTDGPAPPAKPSAPEQSP